LTRRGFVSLLAGLAATVSAPAAAAQPLLAGEIFVGTPVVTSVECDPSGVSTFTYTVTGIATGPYPGTFTETGTARIGPQPPSPPGGIRPIPVDSFHATFEIDSLLGDVKGTKERHPGLFRDQFIGGCVENDPTGMTAQALGGWVRYRATIDDASGRTLHDHGIASLLFEAVETPTGEAGDFSESFLFHTPAVRPGRGCGDPNHVHERLAECTQLPG
jgi:hypothetical protein